ncbi:MAG: hypothetical protein ABSF50_01795 [Burkholderiaceae bacterium]|jgi:hypothetical protein
MIASFQMDWQMTSRVKALVVAMGILGDRRAAGGFGKSFAVFTQPAL